jgi:mono/diheme cytochrome c family protein
MRWFLPLLAACVFFPVAAVKAADLTDAEVKAARKLYLIKCAKCHKLYDPAGYDDAAWQSWMAKMTKKAKLNEQQADLISRYVETVRKKARSPARSQTVKDTSATAVSIP